jgi:hypothetical protein
MNGKAKNHYCLEAPKQTAFLLIITATEDNRWIKAYLKIHSCDIPEKSKSSESKYCPRQLHHLIPAHYYLDDGLFTVKICHHTHMDTHKDQGSAASMQHYQADFLRTLIEEDNIMMTYAALLLTHLAHSTVSCTLFLYYMTSYLLSPNP